MTVSRQSYPNLPTPQHIAALAAEVEREPKDLVNKITLANALEQTGDIAKAAAYYREAIAQDPDGVYGSVARKALETLENSNAGREVAVEDAATSSAVIRATETSTAEENTVSLQPLIQNLKAVGSRLVRSWQNLNFRTKLTIFLLCSAAIPALVVTQGLFVLTRENLMRNLKASMQAEVTDLLEDYVLWSVDEARAEANSIAQLVEILNVNLNDPAQVTARRSLLQKFMSNLKVVEGEGSFERIEENIRIVTDAQGRTVAQNLRVLANNYQNLPANRQELNPSYRQVTLPQGIYLGDIPIVRNAIKSGKALGGMELLNGEVLKRLGQDKQVQVGVRSPITQADSSEQPSPAGTYDIDGGRAALVGMVVHPIKLGNKVVGTVIVGAVMNGNPAVVDGLKSREKELSAAVFAKDWQVSSNVPAQNGTSRDLGTRAPKRVTQTVLDRAQELTGITRMAGVDYLGVYHPLYDHQQELNPTQAQPVGMVFVGEPLAIINGTLARQQIVAYSIGIGMLVVVGAIAIPIASSFSKPLKKLVNFAQAVGEGQQGIRLADSQRRDEIGVLTRSLNAMSSNIESNLEAIRQQEARQRIEKERLQRGMINLLLETETVKQGDLVVKAKVSQGETGAIADAFNTVIASLRDIVLQVKAAAEQVQASAADSESSVEKLACEAVTQATAVAEALTSVEEMELSIQAIASSAQTAATIARRALDSAEDSDKTMDETVASMETIRSNVWETTVKAKRLAESSQEISKIVSIISGISEKTNVLAFNAAIEATRAGENGKGFRLVANEVRRLAEKVTDATKEIDRLVRTIQQGTSDVLKTMEVSNASVATGTQLVAKTKHNLQDMAQISQEIDQLLQSISVRTVSQADNSCMVNQTMQTVAEIAQTTSTESAAVLTALQELLEVARELQLSVSRFRVED